MILSDKTYDLDLPETEEDEAKLQQSSRRGTSTDITRGSNILNKVVAARDVTQKTNFTGAEVPTYGVFTDHEAELGKVH